jgi:hypothetical protein
MEVDTNKVMAVMLGLIGVIVFPMGIIWSFNNLFGLQIQYTFFNWLSIVFIQIYIQIILKASFMGASKK